MTGFTPHIAIIGAGIGGLASALRLSHAGALVSVFEAHPAPGGKMRTVPSIAGPVDAGPTVLTMKPVFDALFADVGARLEDHVTLNREHILARHFWTDGTQMDLTADRSENCAKVSALFGARSGREFERFCKTAQTLFESFDGPMMQAVAPNQSALTKHVMRHPSLIPKMAPHLTLQQVLKRTFSEPKLAQLFARYATYVGGLPQCSPALLQLIWHAEERGVWHVEGGMHRLACAIETLAASMGAKFHYNTPVSRIEDGQTIYVNGDRVEVDGILFNGDPRALRHGLLGETVQHAVPADVTEPRSLSACVHSFAAVPAGRVLAGHNVFFAQTPEGEYSSFAHDRMQSDPTLYICAQDRFDGVTPSGPERFEIITNAPPYSGQDTEKERQKCQTQVFHRLRTHGLTFDRTPPIASLTMPETFDQMFPGSAGSLYGRSPHGMMAAFKRPTARTAIRGLYLVGGCAHPGAGIPMATLSARHAAAAILSDLTLTSTSQKAAMLGGMSMASA